MTNSCSNKFKIAVLKSNVSIHKDPDFGLTEMSTHVVWENTLQMDLHIQKVEIWKYSWRV